jgi:hypothetical protein
MREPPRNGGDAHRGDGVLTKSAAYGRFAALDLQTLTCGLVIGLALIAGS